MIRRYRLLIVIYTVAAVVGVREFLVVRSDEPVEWLTPAWSEMTEVVGALNPTDPDTEWLRGLQSRALGDDNEYQRRLEEALGTGVKHNEFLLQEYAQRLVERGEDWQLANWAVNRWRENHPFSRETLALSLGSGPRDDAEAAWLRAELSNVTWIADSRLEAVATADGDRWRVLLTFRPARRVDVREAIAAVTLLSLNEDQRARFAVRCATLRDCTLVPRTGR